MGQGTSPATQVTPPQSHKAGPDLDRRNALEGEGEDLDLRDPTGNPDGDPVIAGCSVDVPRVPRTPSRKKK